ncbi:MAG: response regulator [Bryobacteraceae bacterium]|nr:response regulator [Bryobacteraceae bacterium]
MNRVPRVLVVEDEAHIARLLQFVLTRNGYHVDVAHTGMAGLQKAQDCPPDAVLLDLNLPDMPGADVLAALRRDPNTEDTAVIILSAHAFDYGLDPALRSGRTIQCGKPVAPSRLLDSLAEFGLSVPAATKAG